MKILIIQQRYGIGDILFFYPIFTLYQKFHAPVSLLAKESSRAKDIFAEDNHVKEVITLDKQKDRGVDFLNF